MCPTSSGRGRIEARKEGKESFTLVEFPPPWDSVDRGVTPRMVHRADQSTIPPRGTQVLRPWKPCYSRIVSRWRFHTVWSCRSELACSVAKRHGWFPAPG